jgi:hypothetical protein
MSFRMAFNSVIALGYSLFSRIATLIGGVVIADWKHYPNYYITLDSYISYDQIFAYDVQQDVKVYQDEKGAVVGYIGSDTYIDVSDWMAHITLEGTIIVWGPANDPRGRLCIVSPLNTVINNLAVNGQSVEVVVIPPSAVTFTETNVRWNNSDYPNSWNIPSPPVNIQLHYDTESLMPYVTTHYFVQNVSRYDHPTYNCKYVQNGIDIGIFNSVSTIVSNSTLRMQIDKSCWLLSILKNKYTYEPVIFDLFRRRSYIA